MHFFLYLFIFSLKFSFIRTSDLLTKFNITIKIPRNELSPAQIPYKSIHVKYTLPSNNDQWNIVAIEPFIYIPDKTIREMTVHFCQVGINTYQQNNIWYNDETYCNGARSMLIYQWTSYSPLSTFRIANDLGFPLDKSKSIVLTVTYSNERQLHNDQTGIIIYISTLTPRFYIGTILVGNKRGGIRFSCRSSDYPRLLHTVKPLFSKIHNIQWHIYSIRNRNFGRKLVQSVFDSTMFSKDNKTDTETILSDIFLMPGDYIIIECTQVSETNCKFLIYYIYKNLQYKDFDNNDHTCQDNNYPDLFKLIPSKTIYETNEIPSNVSNIDGTTIFLIVALLLFVIWIAIIIGCIIMRRIRGLVNFRTEATNPFSNQKTKTLFRRQRAGTTDHHNRAIAEGEHIAQLDIEHMGLMS